MLLIRHKISFSAFSKKMTIHELLIRTIQTSYQLFVQEGLFKVYPNLEKIYDKLIPKEIINKEGSSKIAMKELIKLKYTSFDINRVINKDKAQVPQQKIIG